MDVIHRLPKDLVADLERDVLHTHILFYGFSFDEVFDMAYDKYGETLSSEDSQTLSLLTRSMSSDNSEAKFRSLVDAGFDEDFSEQISGAITSFTSDELDNLNSSKSKTQLLENLSALSPFLVSWIKSLDYMVSNTKYVIRRLEDMGLNEDLINRYLLFKSRRPRTDMSIIVDIPIGELLATKLFFSNNPILMTDDWLNKIVEVHQDSFFPVIRYGYGMSKGTYTGRETVGEFCGTFYYYEGDSNIMLKAKDILICPNKICALTYFLGKERVVELFNSSLDEHGEIVQTRALRAKMKYGPITAEIYFNDDRYNTWDIVIDDMMTGRFNFLEHHKKLYAVEDRFDQVLCRAASNRFDLIVLTTMIGEERVVSEILDLRERTVSFSNLVKLAFNDIMTMKEK